MAQRLKQLRDTFAGPHLADERDMHCSAARGPVGRGRSWSCVGQNYDVPCGWQFPPDNLRPIVAEHDDCRTVEKQSIDQPASQSQSRPPIIEPSTVKMDD